jgi:hypothetical protein
MVWRAVTAANGDHEATDLYATQSISTLQSTTMLETTHARAGG